MTPAPKVPKVPKIEETNPDSKLAERVLPRALDRALKHVFAQRLSGCVLAGGTALAGFYAGRRRSDDLDLFTSGEVAQKAAILAVKSLSSIGAELTIEMESAQYFDASAVLDGHRFKVTVVEDPNLFRVAETRETDDGVRVVGLSTLFKMKAATLVSRCSEKDLYDLIWLFRRFPEHTYSDLVRLGSEIDAGVNAEALLLSVTGAILRAEACDFSLVPRETRASVYREILVFRKALRQGIVTYLENEPVPPLGELVRKLEKLRK